MGVRGAELTRKAAAKKPASVPPMPGVASSLPRRLGSVLNLSMSDDIVKEGPIAVMRRVFVQSCASNNVCVVTGGRCFEKSYDSTKKLHKIQVRLCREG